MLTAAASSLGPGSEQEPEPAARSCVWLLHGRVSQWSAVATPARPLPRHRRRARLRHKRDWRPGRASRRLWHLHLLAGHTNEAATLCRADNETCFPKRHRARSLPPDSATAVWSRRNAEAERAPALSTGLRADAQDRGAVRALAVLARVPRGSDSGDVHLETQRRLRDLVWAFGSARGSENRRPGGGRRTGPEGSWEDGTGARGRRARDHVAVTVTAGRGWCAVPEVQLYPPGPPTPP